MRRDTARRGIISFYQMIYVSDHLPDVSGEENFAVIPYFRRRVVSETQCIKDEIFAYRAESARQNCGVLGIVTSIW